MTATTSRQRQRVVVVLGAMAWGRGAGAGINGHKIFFLGGEDYDRSMALSMALSVGGRQETPFSSK